MILVYIGYDAREHDAFLVAEASLRRHASEPIQVVPLCSGQLRAQRLLTRSVDSRGGRQYDLSSDAYQSTEFAVSRFLVPFLAQTGFAVFVDCDVVFTRDIVELLAEADSNKAVQVVKHEYAPCLNNKMDDQPQSAYHRKNWSSVMVWNCDHEANRRLTLDDVNKRRGLELHQFYWLHDSEIGDLNPAWNWLVGEQPKPPEVGVAHFTLGGPWVPGWQSTEHDEIWNNEAVICRST